MSQEKYKAIEKYLSAKMGITHIEQNHDNDRDTQTFKIHLEDGPRLLKVADDFIADNNITDILIRFDQASLADLLLKEKQRKVLITQHGLTLIKWD